MKRHVLSSAGDCGTCGTDQFSVRFRHLRRSSAGGPMLPYEIELEIAEIEHNLNVLIEAFNTHTGKGT